MGYRVLGNTEELFKGYGPRKGLEGPFNFSGKILYYDAREGAYWDPTTDFFMSQEEMDELNARLYDTLKA